MKKFYRNNFKFFDAKTYRFYCKNASQMIHHFAAAPGEEGILRYFPEAFEDYLKNRKIICDYGSGSGRDLSFLQKKGYRVIGIEPCSSMLFLSEKLCPSIKRKVYDSILDFPKSVHGIFFSGVLQHIPTSWMDALLSEIFVSHSMIQDVLISIPMMKMEISSRRDAKGRLMLQRPIDFYIQSFKRYGFTLKKEWENSDAMKRERTWKTLWLHRSKIRIK